MISSNQKSTGTDYTPTVALLVAAFVFSPVVLLVSLPFGHDSVYLALACSALCAALAYASWTKYSNLTLASVVTQPWTA